MIYKIVIAFIQEVTQALRQIGQKTIYKAPVQEVSFQLSNTTNLKNSLIHFHKCVYHSLSQLSYGNL